jgi:hypothetical protein
MADQDQIDAAARDAKLVLLEQIKKSAASTTIASALERLAYAYSLTVGGAFGKLPGGPTQITTSS